MPLKYKKSLPELSNFLSHCEPEGRGNLTCEEIASHPMGARNDIRGKGVNGKSLSLGSSFLR
jgi:hypothetical protein